MKQKYFVLRPSDTDPHGIASMHAMEVYADAIKRHDPELCDELHAWVNKIKGNISQDFPTQRETLYIKALRCFNNPIEGGLDVCWKQSTDEKNWETKTETLYDTEINLKQYDRLPPEVTSILIREKVLQK